MFCGSLSQTSFDHKMMLLMMMVTNSSDACGVLPATVTRYRESDGPEADGCPTVPAHLTTYRTVPPTWVTSLHNLKTVVNFHRDYLKCQPL